MSLSPPVYHPSNTAGFSAATGRVARNPRASQTQTSTPRNMRDADIRSATRKALGYGHDTFEPENSVDYIAPRRGLTYHGDYNRTNNDAATRRYTDNRYHEPVGNSHEEPIPQRYIAEFNRRWHEDTEEHDADQYMADMTPKAPWRKHVSPTDGYGVLPPPQGVKASPRPSSSSSSKLSHGNRSRASSSLHVPSEVSSRFSDDSDDSEAPKPRRRLLKFRKGDRRS
ncbi:hypothetical protein P280DRAFT_519597 [Massarina eburnea CBS 473.64]|uniref:Pal1-domain-containing protein n=1 Tax=Massarina eburnea CBS 473.64 TaxID=1395130 RepID=A0A6A6RWL0_9PLEO|nr:hypothetical protein P280DRAFT_519597 [Massarina eburnea CBS 473.64]